MTLQEIVNRVNKLLAGERHSFAQLVDYLDRTIDDINSQLNSTFPVFSELPDGKAEYDYFPDRYIRSVVTVGAAWYYFSTDEEGNQTAPQYMYDYERGMFTMSRDYHNLVPLEYQQGVHLDEEGNIIGYDSTGLYEPRSAIEGERGVTVDVNAIFPI